MKCYEIVNCCLFNYYFDAAINNVMYVNKRQKLIQYYFFSDIELLLEHYCDLLNI